MMRDTETSGWIVQNSSRTLLRTLRLAAVAVGVGLVMTAGSDFHDIRHNTRGVGMDVDDADIAPFLALVS